MTPEEKEQIKLLQEKISSEFVLGFVPGMNDRNREIKKFCDEISKFLPRMQVKTDRDMEVNNASIVIENRILYQAVPGERELDPFLRVLSDRDGLMDELPLSVKQKLDLLQIPSFIKVYITPGCPFCPKVVTGLLGMALFNENIRLTVIDGVLYPESAQQDNISSAPTVLLDDQFRWTGSINFEEIAVMVVNRDPADLSSDSFKGMIEDGNADGVARILLENKTILPSFIELIAHDKWPVRLGAMVAFEILADENPGLAERVARPLWELFEGADNGAKGDILHVIGESGNKGIKDRIAVVADGNYNTEVKEAAREAFEKLVIDK